MFASRPAKTNRVNEQLSVSRTGTKRRPASFYAAMSLVNAPGTALKLKQNLSSGSLAASGGSPLLTGTLRFIQTTTPSTYNCAPLSTTQVPSNFKNGSKPFTAHFRAIGNQRLVRTAPVAGYVNRTQ